VNMITRAIVQSAIVLMNRRMKAEREVRMFVPVCSSVAGMLCIISKDEARRKENAASAVTFMLVLARGPRTPNETKSRHAVKRGGSFAVAEIVDLGCKNQLLVGDGSRRGLVQLNLRTHFL